MHVQYTHNLIDRRCNITSNDTARLPLLLTKIENQQFEANQPVNISEIVEKSIEQLEDYFSEMQLSFQTQIEKNIVLNANEHLIETLFTNLIFNAIQHNSEQGRISISLN